MNSEINRNSNQTAGSSNSQDSFPNQTGANTNIDGYPGYTGPGGYPPPPGGPGPDYNAVPQRPPSQSNAQTHPGKIHNHFSSMLPFHSKISMTTCFGPQSNFQSFETIVNILIHLI